jgi:hypothetical protein
MANEPKINIMKHKTLLLAFLPALALAAGCDKEPTVSQQLDQAKVETKAAAQDLKDFAYAQKAEFVAKMQGQLNEINRDLDELGAKIDKSSAAVKAEAQPKLQAVRDQAAQLTKQLDEVKSATESTWETAKNGARKSTDALLSGIQEARQWVSDKIAP